MISGSAFIDAPLEGKAYPLFKLLPTFDREILILCEFIWSAVDKTRETFSEYSSGDILASPNLNRTEGERYVALPLHNKVEVAMPGNRYALTATL